MNGPEVTVADLAETLKVTTRTIERWIQKRDLPPRVKMPGMTPYWPADVLEQWLKDRGISPLSALYAKAHGGSEENNEWSEHEALDPSEVDDETT